MDPPKACIEQGQSHCAGNEVEQTANKNNSKGLNKMAKPNFSLTVSASSNGSAAESNKAFEAAAKNNAQLVRTDPDAVKLVFCDVPVDTDWNGQATYAYERFAENGQRETVEVTYNTELTISTIGEVTEELKVHNLAGSKRMNKTDRLAYIGAAEGLMMRYSPAAGPLGRYLIVRKDVLTGHRNSGFIGMINMKFFGHANVLKNVCIGPVLKFDIEFPVEYSSVKVDGHFIQWFAMFADTPRSVRLAPMGFSTEKTDMNKEDVSEVRASFEREELSKNEEHNRHFMRSYFNALSLLAEGYAIKFSIEAFNHSGNDGEKALATRKDGSKFSYVDADLIMKSISFAKRITMTPAEYEADRNNAKFAARNRMAVKKNEIKALESGKLEKTFVSDGNGRGGYEYTNPAATIEKSAGMSDWDKIMSREYTYVYRNGVASVVRVDELNGTYKAATINRSIVENKAAPAPHFNGKLLNITNNFARQQFKIGFVNALIFIG